MKPIEKFSSSGLQTPGGRDLDFMFKRKRKNLKRNKPNPLPIPYLVLIFPKIYHLRYFTRKGEGKTIWRNPPATKGNLGLKLK
jgi:hypothetical protein